jgi:hypothetical protein
VRTEARRLRGKLRDYDETEGKDDPVYVYVRPGSYVPVFQCKQALGGQGTTGAEAPSLSTKTCTIGMAITAQEHDVAAWISEVGAQIAFEGSVSQEGNHIRVTARVVSAGGFQLWAKPFDAEANSSTLLAIKEQLFSASRNSGAVATVSALAFMVESPISASSPSRE